MKTGVFWQLVHGGIRHLENEQSIYGLGCVVHGGIRHLETWQAAASTRSVSSWRHTPFRNTEDKYQVVVYRSWRHTPFRKFTAAPDDESPSSWRHTPFRNL